MTAQQHATRTAPPPTQRAALSIQRKCGACGTHTPGGEACTDCRRKRPPLQTRLAIGPVDDPYEREADRVAARVLADPVSPRAGRVAPRIQRFAGAHAAPAAQAPASVDAALHEAGSALDGATRADMQARFGHDFSGVRVHSGTAAARSAAEIGALAYTVGSDIVFAAGRFAPATADGRTLLAHELTHVVQQGGGQQGGGQQGGGRIVQRSLDGCRAMLAAPSPVSLISGSVVHAIIGRDFQSRVKGAVQIAIPGASAGALRSQGICGGDDKVIKPQLTGGGAGLGFPDLAVLGPTGVLQVAEIKPAVVPCLIDGEEQLLRYIDQGNARDDAQAAWRAVQGIKVVSPMLPGSYTPPDLALALPNGTAARLRTNWCAPGLMGYTVEVTGRKQRAKQEQKKKVPVPASRTMPVPKTLPVPVPHGGSRPVAEPQTGPEPQTAPVPEAVPDGKILPFPRPKPAAEPSPEPEQIPQAARSGHSIEGLKDFLLKVGVPAALITAVAAIVIVAVADPEPVTKLVAAGAAALGIGTVAATALALVIMRWWHSPDATDEGPSA